MTLDKDTVIGELFNDCCNPSIVPSDLDDEYQKALLYGDGKQHFDGLIMKHLVQDPTIAELEAKVAALEKAAGRCSCQKSNNGVDT